MASMYEMMREYDAALYCIETADTEEERETAWQQLCELGGSMHEKGEQYAYYIRNTESEVAGLKKEIDRLTAMKRRKEATVERLKSTLLEAMNKLGEEDIETSIGKWKKKLNNPSVADVDMDRLPDEFIVTEVTRTADKKAILAWAKAHGEAPAGAVVVRKESVGFR